MVMAVGATSLYFNRPQGLGGLGTRCTHGYGMHGPVQRWLYVWMCTGEECSLELRIVCSQQVTTIIIWRLMLEGSLSTYMCMHTVIYMGS